MAAPALELLDAPACGNCRHRSPRGKCRHLGTPFVGRQVGTDWHPCAWWRHLDDGEPLPGPYQLLRRDDDMRRILVCNVPRGYERLRAGWTERTAERAGIRVIEAPAAPRRALPYTQVKE